ncbi:hypothetical protein CFC21_068048 [Triticum aestivum]|uniref:Uncharacterized protein n=4 Tax=Triticum TaxID=4564 RepID=A0A9R0TZD2_TRITD|nr:hypothetical protein TRIUR3_22575 [Triticum urartu]KAF7061351.1 hypothetical protein CFC21_068048 [Triticum aestivum]VAI22867.1 unnamed protein product [Triticum turgidum subsp. durum]
MWLRVMSLSLVHPPSAMVSSNSSRIMRSTFRTPASPSAASANTTGRPICKQEFTGVDRWLTKTPEAPRASALKTSVPRRTPPSRYTGMRPWAAVTTSSRALMVAGT